MGGSRKHIVVEALPRGQDEEDETSTASASVFKDDEDNKDNAKKINTRNPKPGLGRGQRSLRGGDARPIVESVEAVVLKALEKRASCIRVRPSERASFGDTEERTCEKYEKFFVSKGEGERFVKLLLTLICSFPFFSLFFFVAKGKRR